MRGFPSITKILALRCSVFFAFAAVLLISSCKGYKTIPYFKDVPDSARGNYKVPVTSFEEMRIQSDDIIQISIQTTDAQVNEQIAVGSGMTYATSAPSMSIAGNPTPNGYLVDKSGFIDIPLTGRLHVAGLTTEQARDTIRRRATLYYKSPVVNVRFTNFQITVLGEVLRPATYVIPNEHVDVLQALGMAGDITIYGKRENVMVIREEKGQKVFARLNLNSSEIFQSPFFQLRQRDIVYVEPAKTKAASTDAAQTRIITLLGTVVSVLIILVSRTKF